MTEDVDALRARVAELEGREAEHAGPSSSRTRCTGSPTAASAAEDLPGVLRHGPRHRRRADGRAELLHRPLRRRAPGDQLPVLRRHRRHGHPRSGTPGSRSASATPRGPRRTSCGPGGRRSFDRRRWQDLSRAARSRSVGERRPTATGSARRSSPRAGHSASIVVQTYDARAPTHDGRPRAPGVRRPAHRIGAEPRPRDRGDAPAQRRAGARQRDRRGARRSQLDFDAIIELVGERVRHDLRCRSRCSSRLYDAATQLSRRSAYEIDEGQRFQTEPFPLGAGPDIDRSSGRAAPLRLGTDAEAVAARCHLPWDGVESVVARRPDPAPATR